MKRKKAIARNGGAGETKRMEGREKEERVKMEGIMEGRGKGRPFLVD